MTNLLQSLWVGRISNQPLCNLLFRKWVSWSHPCPRESGTNYSALAPYYWATLATRTVPGELHLKMTFLERVGFRLRLALIVCWRLFYLLALAQVTATSIWISLSFLLFFPILLSGCCVALCLMAALYSAWLLGLTSSPSRQQVLPESSLITALRWKQLTWCAL